MLYVVMTVEINRSQSLTHRALRTRTPTAPDATSFQFLHRGTARPFRIS